MLPRIASNDAEERLFHLVQDDDLIRHIHAVEIPPNSYYEELKKHVTKLHPDVETTFIEHCVLVAGAFDTAAAFALSFGIAVCVIDLGRPQLPIVVVVVGRLWRRSKVGCCIIGRRQQWLMYLLSCTRTICTR